VHCPDHIAVALDPRESKLGSQVGGNPRRTRVEYHQLIDDLGPDEKPRPELGQGSAEEVLGVESLGAQVVAGMAGLATIRMRKPLVRSNRHSRGKRAFSLGSPSMDT
jgi:hypothetical protein